MLPAIILPARRDALRPGLSPIRCSLPLVVLHGLAAVPTIRIGVTIPGDCFK